MSDESRNGRIREEWEALEAIEKRLRSFGASTVVALVLARSFSNSPESAGYTNWAIGAAVIFGILTFRYWRSKQVAMTHLRELGVDPRRNPGTATAEPPPAHSSAPAAHEAPPAAAEVRERWIRLRIEPDPRIAFRTREDSDAEPDGELELANEDVELAYRFLGNRRDDGAYIDFAQMETRVRDRQGRWWQTSTLLHTDGFSQIIRPSSSESDGEDSIRNTEVYFWRDVPEAWRRAIEDEGCLATGVSGELDTRERYRLKVGDSWQVLMLKYQGPNVDLACLDGDSKLVVRMKSLVLEHWDPDPWNVPEGEEARFVDIVENVSLGFLLEPASLCLLLQPDVHRADWDSRYEEPESADALPVFEPASAPE